MVKRVLDETSIKLMSMFEKVTRAGLKDIIVKDSKIYFIVNNGEIGKALGKGATNVKKLEKAFNRKIKIVEFNPDIIAFVKNVIFPSKGEITQNGDIIEIQPIDLKTRGYLIGRNATTLKENEEIVTRFFPISKIKINQ